MSRSRREIVRTADMRLKYDYNVAALIGDGLEVVPGYFVFSDVEFWLVCPKQHGTNVLSMTP